MTSKKLEISWSRPASDGGLSVTSYNLYVNNALEASLNPSLNFYVLDVKEGKTYKLQVSAVNEIGESLLSLANTVLHAMTPDMPDVLTLSSLDYPASISIRWTAPLNTNGDDVWGYRVYLDNGRGGPFRLIYDSVGYSSIYEYQAALAEQVECGYLYNVRVAAVNTAGEGAFNQASIWVGVAPSPPLNPRMTSVTPMSTLSLDWVKPADDGCLPILSYSISKNGVEAIAGVDPSLTTVTDDISVGGAIGTSITYQIKALNVNGASQYSEPLTVKVGLVPNPPTGLAIRQILSATSM